MLHKLKQHMSSLVGLFMGLTTMLVPNIVYASTGLDKGDTGLMLTSTLLVLLMALPGLALFYSGLVSTNKSGTIIMESYGIAMFTTILYVLMGYGIAFGHGNGLFGSLHNFALKTLSVDGLVGTIPESLFVMFHLALIIFTTALIIGAFSDRIRYTSLLLFTGAWGLLVYAPVCHMVKGGGYLSHIGMLDYSGGSFIHMTAGIAALVTAMYLAGRNGKGHVERKPHNVPLFYLGAILLVLGSLGLIMGSVFAIGGKMSMALLVTIIAGAVSSFTYLVIDLLNRKKPTLKRLLTGTIIGLVGITPAAGYIMPLHAIIMALLIGLLGHVLCHHLKRRFGHPDIYDIFGVFGVGSILGMLLTGVFVASPLGIAQQLIVQLKGIGVIVLFTGIMTYAILYVLDRLIGLRSRP